MQTVHVCSQYKWRVRVSAWLKVILPDVYLLSPRLSTSRDCSCRRHRRRRATAAVACRRRGGALEGEAELEAEAGVNDEHGHEGGSEEGVRRAEVLLVLHHAAEHAVV